MRDKVHATNCVLDTSFNDDIEHVKRMEIEIIPNIQGQTGNDLYN